MFLVRYYCLFLFLAPTAPQWARASSFTRFLDHTQRRSTVSRTPLDEWSARRRDLYLTKHNTADRHPFFRWNSNPQSLQASGRRPTPRGHWGQRWDIIRVMKSCKMQWARHTLNLNWRYEFPVRLWHVDWYTVTIISEKWISSKMSKNCKLVHCVTFQKT